MKTNICLLVVCCLGFNLLSVKAADTNPPPRLTVELRDGSSVVGISGEEYFKFHSASLGEIKLAVQTVRAVECEATNSAKLTLTNGDVLMVEFGASEFAVQTSFGKVELAVGLVRKFTVSSGALLTRGLKFNLGNRVEIPNDPQLQFHYSPFTISFWVKTTTQRPTMSFIAKRSSALGDGWVVHEDQGQLLFYCAGCCSPRSRPVSINDGQWHHVAVARTGGSITFYLDGNEVGSGSTGCSHDDNNPIRIGMDGTETTNHFEGEIAEVHFYGRALDAGEVAGEWNHGQRQSGSAGPGLIAGYHLDEAAGTVAKDFSGNHHDGTLINNPEWEN